MKTYELTTPTGFTYTAQLSDAEAEARGLKSAPKPENKRGREPENKAQDEPAREQTAERTVSRPGAQPRRK